MNRQIALCCAEGVGLVFNRVKLLSTVDNVVLQQDTCNGMVAGIGFQNSLKRMIELSEDRRG